MKTGEIRIFKVHKSNHPHCSLVTDQQDPNTITFEVEKLKNIPDMPDTMRRLVVKNRIPNEKNPYGQFETLNYLNSRKI